MTIHDPVTGFAYPDEWVRVCADKTALEQVRQGLAVLTSKGTILKRGGLPPGQLPLLHARRRFCPCEHRYRRFSSVFPAASDVRSGQRDGTGRVPPGNTPAIIRMISPQNCFFVHGQQRPHPVSPFMQVRASDGLSEQRRDIRSAMRQSAIPRCRRYRVR